MTTARTVPVTTEMDGDELDAEDAWLVVRRTGPRRLFTDAFLRFRFGDGFSSSRALALQSALAVVPFIGSDRAGCRHRRGAARARPGPHHRGGLARFGFA